MAFHSVKAKLRTHGFDILKDVQISTRMAMASIPRGHCRNFFRACGYHPQDEEGDEGEGALLVLGFAASKAIN